MKLKTIIFPESYDKRVLKAVEFILTNNLAKVILIKTDDEPSFSGFKNKNLRVIQIEQNSRYLREFHNLRYLKNSNTGIFESRRELNDPLTFACLLLKKSKADGIIAGSTYTTSDVLRKSIFTIGLQKNNKTVSSFFIFTFPPDHLLKNRTYAFADCAVIPNPTSHQLSDIAIQTSENFYKLTGKKPRIAFLSFSTKGSAKDISITKILEALEITKKKKPGLVCDGEIQLDAALIPEIGKMKNPDGIIKGDANVFIFPDLNSGNIAYKITERIGGAYATGPVIQGLAKPVMDLSRGCSAEDIISMTKVIIKLLT